jgi:hypothetical protein
VRDAARRAGAVAVSAEEFVAALRGSTRDDEDADDGGDGVARRGGNPRRLSRDERAARRALARLRGR